MIDLVECPYCKIGSIKTSCKNCTKAECQNCHYNFCPMCLQNAHPDITCENNRSTMNETEQRKFNDNRLTQHYVSTQVKVCPSCNTKIVRDGGCSHMTCKVCKYEFCYLCLQKYKGKYVAAEMDKCSC